MKPVKLDIAMVGLKSVSFTIKCSTLSLAAQCLVNDTYIHPIPRRRGVGKGAEDRLEVRERASEAVL